MKSELDRLCAKKNVRIDCEWADENPNMADMPQGSSHYKVRLRYHGRQMTTFFSCGPAICEQPSAADVLSCCCSDSRAGEQSFEEFCSEFGYDEDSRKAEKTWKACENNGEKVRRLLGDDYETFCNAEH